MKCSHFDEGKGYTFTLICGRKLSLCEDCYKELKKQMIEQGDIEK